MSDDPVDDFDEAKSLPFTPRQLAYINRLIGEHGSVEYSVKNVDKVADQVLELQEQLKNLALIAQNKTGTKFMQAVAAEPGMGRTPRWEYYKVFRAAEAYYEATGGVGPAVKKLRTGELVVDLDEPTFKPYFKAHVGENREIITSRQFLMQRGRNYVTRVSRDMMRQIGWVTERPYALVLKAVPG